MCRKTRHFQEVFDYARISQDPGPKEFAKCDKNVGMANKF